MKAILSKVKQFLKENRIANDIVAYGVIPIVCAVIVIGQAYMQHAESVNFILFAIVAGIGAKISSYIHEL